jgi:hypothetical protein
VWAGKVGISYKIDSVRMLHNIIYSMLFLYFGSINPFNIKLLNMSIFQIHKVPYIHYFIILYLSILLH